MESFIGSKQMVYYFSFADTDKDNIILWYKSLDRKVLQDEAKKIIEMINKDEKMFKNKLLEFVLGENK